MLNSLLLKNIRPCIIVLIKQKSLEAYLVKDLEIKAINCDSYVHDYLIYTMQTTAFQLKTFLREQRIENPELIISIDSSIQTLTDSLFALDDYYYGAYQVLPLESCVKFLAVYIKHEIKMHYQLFAQLITKKKVTLATDTLFLIQLLKHHGHVPPRDCNNIHDLETWIEKTCATHFTKMETHLAIKNLYLAGQYEIN